jgi:hypothetical protein
MNKLLIILAAAIAFSCSDKQAQQQPQNSANNQTVSIQKEQSDPNSKAIEKIQSFYSNYVFGTEEANDSVIAQYCTKGLALVLSKAYDNEISDGGGYAVWKFRSSAQDGEDIHEVEKIEPLGNGKYLVHYNDMGNKGTHTITIVQQDGEIFFDKLD